MLALPPQRKSNPLSVPPTVQHFGELPSNFLPPAYFRLTLLLRWKSVPLTLPPQWKSIPLSLPTVQYLTNFLCGTSRMSAIETLPCRRSEDFPVGRLNSLDFRNDRRETSNSSATAEAHFTNSSATAEVNFANLSDGEHLVHFSRFLQPFRRHASATAGVLPHWKTQRFGLLQRRMGDF